MDTLTDISPYRLTDPTQAQAALTEIAGLCGVGEDDPHLHMLPSSPLPVIEPGIMVPERPRTLGLLHLPHPYLPDEVRIRRPRERYGSYLTRINLALDELGLLEVADGHIRFAAIPGAPDTMEAGRAMLAALDGDADCDAWNTIRADIDRRAREAWPDGYPLPARLEQSARITAITMRGCAVLAAHHALALLDAGGDAALHAPDTVAASVTLYGPLYCPDPTPATLPAWVADHAGDAIGMMRSLNEAGLEPAGTVEAVEAMLR